MADADIGRGAHSDVVRFRADIFEIFLDRDADRRTATPDAYDKIRPETTPVYFGRQPERVL